VSRKALAAEFMFFSINLWLVLLFVAAAVVAGYFGSRASHSIIVGIFVGLATFVVLIASSALIAWRRAH
jgi:hypothetical protein